jgi:hypothetical protein
VNTSLKHLHFISLLGLAFLLGSCDQATDLSPAGAYRYAACDTTGTLVVHGWFTMVLSDSDSITGEWHFAAVGSPQHIGPQTGDGKLVGGFHDTTLWIELQPDWVDNNLQLRGTLKGDRYAGTWEWISFKGRTNWGRFEAVKQ